MSTRLLLLGLDGVDPNFVQRHLNTLPNLACLIQSGTWEWLRSTISPLTSVAWTTAMSGTNPGKPGISGFVKSDFALTQELIDSRSVAVPHIWNVLWHPQLQGVVVGAPMVYPAERVNGIMEGPA